MTLPITFLISTLSLMQRYWKLAAYGVLIAALGVQTFRVGRLKGHNDDLRREAGVWQSAQVTNLATIGGLIGTLKNQTASIRDWSQRAEQRRAAAQQELRKAERRAERLEAAAQSIERELVAIPPVSVISECRTPDAVMRAKGDF